MHEITLYVIDIRTSTAHQIVQHLRLRHKLEVYLWVIRARLLAGSPSGLLDFVSATLSISMSATTFHLHVHHHIIKLVGHIVNLNVLHQHNTTST